ncbi:hypothetical protein ACFFS2_28920 [Streptomyces aurantiacus]|uniref:ScoMcrA-like SRA domain-containing protein n=1 Tax=Streptomyces aurantiacus TaxID=47760 RepID=A0A7G1P4T1_9ACTN|nr:hypothetical protein [Streptomyces aurantiacus]BCL30358.1 hypothetical protein GCM10017557_52170 [Streptomyces aurantiacus]
MNESPLEPGQLTTRAKMKERFGGGVQEGIILSKSTPNILIYTDRESGSEYGYEDGWLEEDNDQGPIFEYTGKGPVGHQTFEGVVGSRNNAILHHADNGKALRLFMAAGKDPTPGSAAKLQRYIGEFELDSKRPYTIREADDPEGNRRLIIVFRLRPKGMVQHIPEDAITPAKQTQVQQVSAAVTVNSIVEPPSKRASESRRSAQPSTVAEHRKIRLLDEYLRFLEEQQHKVFAYQIKIAGTRSVLKTDLYDSTDHVLYCVKGESSREEVRMAIGQLKDYVRHIDPANPKLAVLLPENPHEDLQDLLIREGISLVYQDGEEYLTHTTGS